MTTIKVYEYNSTNFKKTGGLSKRAKYECSFTVGGDGKEADQSFYKNTADGIRKNIPNITKIETPYIFTHIKLEADGKRYMVFQDFTLPNGDTLMTSPTKLREALNQN
jgi:hypothetical protein